MANEIAFLEGRDFILNSGPLPTTCWFLLSTKKVGAQAAGEFSVVDTIAVGMAELTAAGYARNSTARPTFVNGIGSFGALVWNSGSGWSQNPKSIVLCTASGGTAKAVLAQNLRSDGTIVDMSGTQTVLSFSFTIFIKDQTE